MEKLKESRPEEFREFIQRLAALKVGESIAIPAYLDPSLSVDA
jgi:hypothetical protein